MSTDSAQREAGPAALAPMLEQLLELSDGLLPATSRRNLEAALDRVYQHRFNIVVLGEFKRGKSTLINALLGRDLLPAGVLPLTTAATIVRAGPSERLLVHREDGSVQERPLDDLPRFVTEELNPRNRLGVAVAIAEIQHELLAGGLQLVDTPGIGSVHLHNTQAARDVVPQVDAALCVLGADQPLSHSEREFLSEVAATSPRVLVAINKTDILDSSDHDRAVGFVRHALTEAFDGEAPEVLAVSARNGTGIEALAAAVRAFGPAERASLLERSVRGVTASLAEQAAATAAFEVHAIELPLDELELRANQFERRIGDLERSREEATALLERGVQEVLEQRVNGPLSELAAREAARLRIDLAALVAEHRDLSPRGLACLVDEWIDERVSSDFARLAPDFEREIAEALAALQSRYAERIEQILVEVGQAAADVFETDAVRRLPDTGLREAPRFSFKLHDPSHALDRLVALARTLAPGRLGRHLIASEAERRLLRMTDRHAGRLRAALTEAVREAARAYQRELASTVAEAIAAIRDGASRAAEERRHGEQMAAVRTRYLRARQSALQQLAEELSVATGEPPVNR
jgi:small GTP-binding protein